MVRGTEKMRILIADCEPRVRYALSVLLQERKGWMVAGSAADEKEMLDQFAAARPDVLLLDWNILKNMKPDELSRMRRQAGGLSVIVLSTDPGRRQDAVAGGADHFICKIDPPTNLLQILRACDRRISENDHGCER
jgi:DNA-binding NarL/FixJ family response regulator